MSARNQPPRLGELLMQQGAIGADQLQIALTEQRHTRQLLGRQLVKLGFVSEAVVRDAMARIIGRESVDLSQVVADAEALKLVPVELARRHRILPIAYRREQRLLIVATTELFNIVGCDQLRASLGDPLEIKTLLAGEAELEQYINQFYGYELSVDAILREIDTGEIDRHSLQADHGLYTQPMVRLVWALLLDAAKRGASDLHFEPEQSFLRIRQRIDGVLEPVRSLHKSYWPGIAVRLKVISGMNIAETRAPQDGRLSLTLNGRPVDFRVSTQPTIHGENIVLRVLDREKSIIPLERMGLPEPILDRLRGMLARPQGMLVVTGPTGSGKTTLLYALLAQINSAAVNIMTLEDPVEYPVMLMRQSSINETAKLNFADGIRAILRQDPDIILVGEMRDHETAAMALRAAMTGHQVFSTLHTNSALATFQRLLDIGIPPDIVAGNIVGVIAQRLVRVLCPHCKQAYSADAAEKQLLGKAAHCAVQLYRPAGCAHCQMKGYQGRSAVIEALSMDDDFDELVARRASLREMETLARAKGLRPLAENAVALALAGVTSLAEIARAIDLGRRVQPAHQPAEIRSIA